MRGCGMIGGVHPINRVHPEWHLKSGNYAKLNLQSEQRDHEDRLIGKKFQYNFHGICLSGPRFPGIVC